MIKEIPGNILTPAPPGSPPTLVCHQVNCHGVIGSGLALQIREHYPVVFESYRKKCAANALFGGKRPSAAKIAPAPLTPRAGHGIILEGGTNHESV